MKKITLSCCLAVILCLWLWSKISVPTKTAQQSRAGDSIALSYALNANAQFSKQIELARESTARKLNGKLCIPLAGEKLVRKPRACPEQDNSQEVIVHAMILRDGVVWRFYSSHSWAYDRAQSFGSIAKVVPGLAYLAQQHAHTGERWCQKSFLTFQNADGFRGHSNCAHPDAHVTPIEAIAKSNNLAFRWRLAQEDQGQLRAVMSEMDIHGVDKDYDPAINVAFGHTGLSPRQILECFDALVSGTARRAAFIKDAAAPPSRIARWCAKSVSEPSRHQYVKTMLAAPSREGTSRHLQAMFPEGIVIHSKTGTPSITRLDLGKALVATLQHGGHRYTFLAAALSPSPSAPLSPRLGSGDFSEIHRVISNHILGGES